MMSGLLDQQHTDINCRAGPATELQNLFSITAMSINYTENVYKHAKTKTPKNNNIFHASATGPNQNPLCPSRQFSCSTHIASPEQQKVIRPLLRQLLLGTLVCAALCCNIRSYWKKK
jgi:hypothetical protein